MPWILLKIILFVLLVFLSRGKSLKWFFVFTVYLCWAWRYIFSTEGHLLPSTPQISLLREHCSYLGAYCRSSNLRQETESSEIIKDSRGTNQSESFMDADTINIQSRANFPKSLSSGLIKGYCPGLTHGQRYGISYVGSDDHVVDEPSSSKKAAEATVILISSNNSDTPSSTDVDEHSDNKRDTEEDHPSAAQLESDAAQNVDHRAGEAGDSSES